LNLPTTPAYVSNAQYTYTRSQFGRSLLTYSIELAPILGLSDVIVDIVETGTTLKENDLEVVETIFPISARLIANKASFKFKTQEIEALAKKVKDLIESV